MDAYKTWRNNIFNKGLSHQYDYNNLPEDTRKFIDATIEEIKNRSTDTNGEIDVQSLQQESTDVRSKTTDEFKGIHSLVADKLGIPIYHSIEDMNESPTQKSNSPAYILPKIKDDGHFSGKFVRSKERSLTDAERVARYINNNIPDIVETGRQATQIAALAGTEVVSTAAQMGSLAWHPFVKDILALPADLLSQGFNVAIFDFMFGKPNYLTNQFNDPESDSGKKYTMNREHQEKLYNDLIKIFKSNEEKVRRGIVDASTVALPAGKKIDPKSREAISMLDERNNAFGNIAAFWAEVAFTNVLAAGSKFSKALNMFSTRDISPYTFSPSETKVLPSSVKETEAQVTILRKGEAERKRLTIAKQEALLSDIGKKYRIFDEVGNANKFTGGYLIVANLFGKEFSGSSQMSQTPPQLFSEAMGLLGGFSATLVNIPAVAKGALNIAEKYGYLQSYHWVTSIRDIISKPSYVDPANPDKLIEGIDPATYEKRHMAYLVSNGFSLNDVKSMKDRGELKEVYESTALAKTQTEQIKRFLKIYNKLPKEVRKNLAATSRQQFEALDTIKLSLAKYDPDNQLGVVDGLDTYIAHVVNLTQLQSLHAHILGSKKGFISAFWKGLKGEELNTLNEDITRQSEILHQAMGAHLKSLQKNLRTMQNKGDVLEGDMDSQNNLLEFLSEIQSNAKKRIDDAYIKSNNVLNEVTRKFISKDNALRKSVAESLRKTGIMKDWGVMGKTPRTKGYSDTLKPKEEELAANSRELINGQHLQQAKIANDLFGGMNWKAVISTDNLSEALREVFGVSKFDETATIRLDAPTVSSEIRDIVTTGMKSNSLRKVMRATKSRTTDDPEYDLASLDDIDLEIAVREAISIRFAEQTARKNDMLDQLDESLKDASDTITDDARLSPRREMLIGLAKRFVADLPEQKISSSLSISEIHNLRSYLGAKAAATKDTTSKNMYNKLRKAIDEDMESVPDDLKRDILHYQAALDKYAKYKDVWNTGIAKTLIARDQQRKHTLPDEKIFPSFFTQPKGTYVDSLGQFQKLLDSVVDMPNPNNPNEIIKAVDIREEMIFNFRQYFANFIENSVGVNVGELRGIVNQLSNIKYTSGKIGKDGNLIQHNIIRNKRLMREYLDTIDPSYKDIEKEFASSVDTVHDKLKGINKEYEDAIANSIYAELGRGTVDIDKIANSLLKDEVTITLSGLSPALRARLTNFTGSVEKVEEFTGASIIDKLDPIHTGAEVTDETIKIKGYKFLEYLKKEYPDKANDFEFAFQDLYLTWLIRRATKTQEHRSITGRLEDDGEIIAGLSQHIDPVKFADLLLETKNFRREVLPEEVHRQLRAVETATSTTRPLNTAGDADSLTKTAGAFGSLSSVLARVFAIQRGVISVKYVVAEATLREMQKKYSLNMKRILLDPDITEKVIKGIQIQQSTMSMGEKVNRLSNLGSSIRLLSYMTGFRISELAGYTEEEATQAILDPDYLDRRFAEVKQGNRFRETMRLRPRQMPNRQEKTKESINEQMTRAFG